ncbi:MAG: C4-dicarboxylic acid transporter DauA [Micavibrio aeruginosavorus]|uniref:C4-dicarboxylic acid transporter DauA n=1 Tax=Micavibrio aeruginosavorus TaxID=349221 RepID=A0A2W5A4T9_9BACT|nr:MAG: C4-dicarboxylic acid transporter DauA [Micavibrio aeruginosavorus]
MTVRFSFPVSTALRESIAGGYGSAVFKSDLGAALVVALIALPLSMALAIAVGLPPQHGLCTAIIAGIVAAFLGGSRFQVSGPTAAFVAILAPIVAQYGLSGLIWCQLMAGAVLIVLGLSKLGRYIAHVPYAVTTGFTAGIAVVIATLSLNDFFGLHIAHPGGHYWEKAANIAASMPNLTPMETLVSVVTLGVMIVFPRFSKAIPAPIVGIGAGTLLSVFAAKYGMPVDTIASRFPPGIPASMPAFHLPEMTDLMPLILPAVTVALLAALESLLSASVADNITDTKHNPDSELVGIGLGNIACGLFAGIPATGALARTAANIHAGAKTPLASVYHALFLLVFMLALAPYISEIPMAALAALLLITAWRMAHIHLVKDILKAGNREDTALLLVTFILTVIFDMVVGVGAGLALALLFYLERKKS